MSATVEKSSGEKKPQVDAAPRHNEYPQQHKRFSLELKDAAFEFWQLGHRIVPLKVKSHE
jgi:hypothetical protein